MFERRLKIFLGVLSAVVVLLLGRAAQLQVLHAEDWRREANDTLKKVAYVESTRGTILDRTGKELARDRACTDACVQYAALMPQADEPWLKATAKARVRARVGDAAWKATKKAEATKLIAAESEQLQHEIDAMWAKLARVAGRPLEEIEATRQSILQRVAMRKKYIWYQSYLRATRTKGGADSEAEPRWQRWLSGETDDAPEIDKFVVTVGEERQAHVILHDVSLDVQNELARHPEQYPGLVLKPGQTRFYPFEDVACHLLGRIGRVDKKDLLNDPNLKDPRRKYLPNDEIGRSGLEWLCEPALRGTQGMVVTNYGDESANSAEPPVPGRDVMITIDVGLQEDIQRFFAHATLRVKNPATHEYEDLPNQVLHGAAVLLDVKTNQVLALVSNPTFDLNTYDEKLRTLLDNEIDAPLRNRATETQFEPGSTVKPLVGLAGVTAGVVNVNEGIECKGLLELPNRRRPGGKPVTFGRVGRCWVASMFSEDLHGAVAHHPVPFASPHHGHDGNQDGWLTYSDGLERSCNVYFETVADRLGIDALSDWMRRFGLGRRTGIGIEEYSGYVPAQARQDFGNPRTTGFLGGIGQSFVAATPIQMANVASTIARGGIWMRPRLVMPDPKTGAPVPTRETKFDGPDVVDLHLDPEALKACHLGMTNVVNAPGGTGTGARMADLLVAGKTGTAQAAPFRIPEKDPITKKPLKDEDGKTRYVTFAASTRDNPNLLVPWYRNSGTAEKPIIDHSWMIGFAPADNPKIAFGVLVEYGGSGGGAAADVVRQALESCIRRGYLKRRSAPAPTTEPSEAAHD